MCTCFDLKTKGDYYFGRNLDLEYNFNQKVVVTPVNYEFKLKNGTSFKTKYALIGMASTFENYPLYAEASNTKGLSIAGLNFPGNAHYNDPIAGKINIASYELIPWILGNMETVDEVKNAIQNLNITNEKITPNGGDSELHWIVCDINKSIVIEQEKDGLHVYDNKYGVLTNNPPFYFHNINVNNYLNLTPGYAENRFSDKLDLKQYGQGMGALSLPGDVSPQSRFVKTVFNKFNAVTSDNELENVSEFFHILDSVSFVKGTVITKENRYDITTYSCCIDVTKSIYYYKTYDNNQINAVRLTDELKNKDTITIFELNTTQNINYMN